MPGPLGPEIVLKLIHTFFENKLTYTHCTRSAHKTGFFFQDADLDMKNLGKTVTCVDEVSTRTALETRSVPHVDQDSLPWRQER